MVVLTYWAANWVCIYLLAMIKVLCALAPGHYSNDVHNSLLHAQYP